MTTHELKTWPDAFVALRAGDKTHEVRRNDRNFLVGDLLLLYEFVPCERCNAVGRVWGNGDTEDCGCPDPHGRYTGRWLTRKVTYLTPGGRHGLPDDVCVMSVAVNA